MFKKTLISLAVASSVGLTGCWSSGDEGANANPEYLINNPAIDGKTWPLFNPVTGELPIPNDLIFQSDDPDTAIVEADGTFQVTDTSPPVTSALNDLSGASTVAPAVVRFNGQIDPESVDSRPFIITEINGQPTPIPNPSQNVFLIELEYASGDPVQGLGMGEPPTIPLAITVQVAQGLLPMDLEGRDQLAAAQYLAGLAQNPSYTHEVVSLDGTSAIRIHPKEPLNPKKRYLVVVTKEVTDINGDPIIQSPSYGNLTDPDQPLGSASLAPVRTLINSFWETVASGYFALNNAVRPEALSADDIAMSYSFTTSSDQDVLHAIADPQAYFENLIEGAARVAGVKAALAEGTTDFTALLTAAETAAAGSNAATAATQITGALEAQNLLPTPTDRSSTANFGAPQDVTQVSAVASQFVDFGQVNIVQGTIDLPYYLGIPTGSSDAEGSVINTQSWKADATTAAVVSDLIGVQLAQSDATVSDVVNYRFPFPDATSEALTVPIMVLYPAGWDGTTPLETVLYMHGITTDRSAALTFGSALALKANVAVVAIDQPLHGVTPFTAEEQTALAESLLAAGQASEPPLPAFLAPDQSFWPTGNNIELTINGEIAFAFTAVTLDSQGTIDISDGIDATEQAQIEGTIAAALTDAGTGSAQLDAAIRALRSFENTVANAGSTVPGLAKTENERHFDFTANAANMPTAMTATSGESGSLFINLTNFTNSRDKLRQGVVDLLNVRESLAGLDINSDGDATDLDGASVYFTGHSMATIIGAPFAAVANSSTDGADDLVASHFLTPGAGIVRLLENSPTFAPRILGGLQAAAGLEQGDADLETYFNVFQAAVDAADPINFAETLNTNGSKILMSQINGDTVIPNDALEAPLGNAFDAYLSGTEPFARLLGAASVNTTNLVDVGGAQGIPLANSAITRYLVGTHGTPVLPQGGVDDVRAFTEMVSQNASVVATMGGAVIPYAAGDTSDIIQQD